MRVPRIAPATVVALLVSAITVPALADANACASAAERGQHARAAGKLREARTSFLACAADACPALVRGDCQQWASDIEEAMPSIIIDARDANAHDVGDVRVTMDGEVLASSVDGSAIAVDPGPHTFVFERPPSAPVTEKVIIKERAKGRTFVLRFADTTVASPVVAEPAAEPRESRGSRGHTVGPWILIAAGGAFVMTGLIVYLTAPKLPSNCDSTTGSCRLASPSETSAQLTNDRTQAGSSVGLKNAGLIAGAGGLLVLSGGLLWHFLEPTGERRAAQTRIVPWSTGNAGGIAALGAF